jgi:hypothetical protein
MRQKKKTPQTMTFRSHTLILSVWLVVEIEFFTALAALDSSGVDFGYDETRSVIRGANSRVLGKGETNEPR